MHGEYLLDLDDDIPDLDTGLEEKGAEHQDGSAPSSPCCYAVFFVPEVKRRIGRSPLV